MVLSFNYLCSITWIGHSNDGNYWSELSVWYKYIDSKSISNVYTANNYQAHYWNLGCSCNKDCSHPFSGCT